MAKKVVKKKVAKKKEDKLTKAEIIDKLMGQYRVWKAGHTYSKLEAMSEKELREWLAQVMG